MAAFDTIIQEVAEAVERARVEAEAVETAPGEAGTAETARVEAWINHC